MILWELCWCVMLALKYVSHRICLSKLLVVCVFWISLLSRYIVGGRDIKESNMAKQFQQEIWTQRENYFQMQIATNLGTSLQVYCSSHSYWIATFLCLDYGIKQDKCKFPSTFYVAYAINKLSAASLKLKPTRLFSVTS